MNESENYRTKPPKGLQVLWITPLRALAKDVQRNMQLACNELEIPWEVGIRTGDISTAERSKQIKQMPQALIITPESLHLLFAQKHSSDFFKSLHTVVVDEWHELIGSKRGVQTELALARLRRMKPQLQTWGISATIGNLEQAKELLLGQSAKEKPSVIIKAVSTKKIIVETVLPERVETLPWSGYMGVRLLDQVVEIIRKSRSTLVFTNTRFQSEVWYQAIIEKYPEFAGIAALHHGSLDRELRTWVEDAIHKEKMKVVVCTSSLDLGVDFEPVETVIQVGSPKSISRFVQRAGRSGHQPGAASKIYFAPTNSLELIEAVSFREGVEKNVLEDRVPYVLSYDVLAQWMVTLAVGEGFEEKTLFHEIKDTYCYQWLDDNEWKWLLGYITTGSPSLDAYDEFKKVEKEGNLYVVRDRRIAMRHRLSIGTIMSEASLRVKFQHGKYLGSIEETFISRLKPGDIFWFAGRSVRFLRIREMTVTVQLENSKTGIVPQWLGSRMSLSPILSAFIRQRLGTSLQNPNHEVEVSKLMPLLHLQHKRSAVPAADELLIEQYAAKEGHHIFIFPFEGRLVHEGMAAILAHRISEIRPITFSLAMNDYGFELLSDQNIDLEEIMSSRNLFSTENLLDDIHKSVNATEMAKRRFREIATIAGLLFQGFPGKHIKTSHLQSSSSLLFDVMYEYENDNLFIRQAFQEVLDYQLAEVRLREALNRMSKQKIIIRKTSKPSPLSFPLIVDRLREQLSSEKLEARVEKMISAYGEGD
jgi:ATP-dependent Lhr-like helicase